VEPDGRPNHPQPPTRLVELDELTASGGWMRATASSGRAAYEGVIGWSETAGAPTPELPSDEPESETRTP
jgi:hypothetical protein